VVLPEEGNVPPATPPASPAAPPASPAGPAYFPPGKASVPSQPTGYADASYPPLDASQPYLDYGGTPYAPAPRRSTGTMLGIGAVVAVIALAALVGIGYLAYTVVSNAAAPDPTRPVIGTTSTGAGPTAKPNTTPPKASVFDGDLRTLLVQRPAGAQPWDKLKNEDGNLTLDEVVALFSNNVEMRNDLKSFNFKRAAVAHWSKDNVFVLILVFQFNTSRDAGDYIARTKKAGLKDFTARGEFSDIGGSLLYVNETPNTQEQRTTIFLSARNDLVAYTTVWHPGSIDLEGATALATAQHKNLP
jgi:hypothetical protein